MLLGDCGASGYFWLRKNARARKDVPEIMRASIFCGHPRALRLVAREVMWLARWCWQLPATARKSSIAKEMVGWFRFTNSKLAEALAFECQPDVRKTLAVSQRCRPALALELCGRPNVL